MIRTRFAPSPTGYLHVGGARTALYCYLFAKNKGGKFIVRVEDTDEERSTDESMKTQLHSLKWLGLDYDEGVNAESLEQVGGHGPYRQSERLSIYKEHADKLLKEGHAYYCFLSDEEIEKQREEAMKAGRPPQVKSPFRNWSMEKAEAEIKAGKKAVVRFKIPENKTDYKVKDLVRGEVTFPSDMVGDFVLLRSGGMPVYNFCCVIDDALMKMTHVFRAEEHLSNTLRQMMIYQALGYDMPEFGHLSIILGSDKQKLSKRHGATSIGEYADRGYLPEALNNFLALMGWSSPEEGEEVMSMETMIQKFSTDRLNPASAVFDEVKLKWMNSQHLRALPNEELWARTKPFLDQAELKLPDDKNWQNKSLEVFKSSMETLNDAVELYRPLSEDFSIAEEAMEALGWDETKSVVEKWKSLVESHSGDHISEEEFGNYQKEIQSSCGVKGKKLFMPIRVGIIGKPHGAELKILVPLMKKTMLIQRADLVLGRIGS